MLGNTLDYVVLRALAHDRNKATEEALDAHGDSAINPDQLDTKLPKIIGRFEGRFPIDPALRYLDMGCGSGEFTVALARQGVSRITGVDFLPRFVETARANARAAGLEDRVKFVCHDLRTWEPEEKFDVLLSFDSFEHIDTPRPFMARMADFLNPGGRAVLAFGPMFQSPFGDHMQEFFKVQVPWRGVLFSQDAMLRVRRECYRPTDPATRYQDIAGGLNLMRYSEFLDHARATGWTFDYLRTNAFLDNPVLRGLSRAVTSTPGVRDYFVHNVYAVLRRA
jgi:SAM-dependent methyltransferase